MADVDRPDLEHLRHIRGAIDDMRDDIREINQRLGILENQYAGLPIRLDRVDGRIERQLDLTDA